MLFLLQWMRRCQADYSNTDMSNKNHMTKDTSKLNKNHLTLLIYKKILKSTKNHTVHTKCSISQDKQVIHTSMSITNQAHNLS
jgi:hypothetical protein